MVAPIVAAAAISGGAALLGGAMSAHATRKSNELNAGLQREFAQHGIRWKVRDAKAAGLHPLYAMGAVTPSAQASYQSASMGPSVAQAGREVAQGMRHERQARSERMENSKRRQIMQDQLILEQLKARSQINVDTAQANYYNALAAAARADPNNQSDGATSVENIRSEDLPPVTGQYKPKAPEVPIASKDDASMRAGPPAPAFQDVIIIDDKRIPEPLRRLRVPNSDEGPFEEFLEKLPVIAAANWLRYAGWLSSGSDLANYMTPYGRVFLLKKAIQKGGSLFKAYLAKVMDKGRAKRSGRRQVPEGLQYGP